MKYTVTLNDKTYEIEVEKGEAMLVDEYEAKAPAAPAPTAAPAAPAAPTAAAPAAAAAAPAAAASGTPVTAPLPGNILEIKVSRGQSVKKGDLLILIEAMKMENEVLAPCDGTVSSIAVTKGQVVATGDALVYI